MTHENKQAVNFVDFRKAFDSIIRPEL